MGLTLLRWGAGVALGCAALTAALLPFPTSVVERWAFAAPEPLAGEASRWAADSERARAALRAYRSATALALWRTTTRSADTASVRVDRSVPAMISADVRAITEEQWRALGTPSALHAEVFVYVDSTTLPRSTIAATSRRSLERALVDVAFALPEATGGERCVALVRLRGTTAAHVAALRHQSLVGVCGFFAAFGLPGAGVRAWLQATDYRAARRSDWHVALAPAVDASSVYGVGAAGGQCLTGKRGACLTVLGVGRAEAQDSGIAAGTPAFVLDGAGPISAADHLRYRSALGNVEAELLMAAVREFGPERFGQFWRSEAAPDVAFRFANGITLDAWTRQWLTRTFGALPDRPAVRVSHVVWLAVAAPLLLVVAARPRERLLTARWLGVER
jgi:hypothetical protein